MILMSSNAVKQFRVHAFARKLPSINFSLIILASYCEEYLLELTHGSTLTVSATTPSKSDYSTRTEVSPPANLFTIHDLRITIQAYGIPTNRTHNAKTSSQTGRL